MDALNLFLIVLVFIGVFFLVNKRKKEIEVPARDTINPRDPYVSRGNGNVPGFEYPIGSRSINMYN